MNSGFFDLIIVIGDCVFDVGIVFGKKKLNIILFFGYVVMVIVSDGKKVFKFF